MADAPAWHNALRLELAAWKGTPYVLGARAQHVGADCRGFVTGAYDHLYSITDPLPPAVTSPELLEDPAAAYAAYRALVQRYPCARIPTSLDSLEPGDCVVFVKEQDPNHLGHVGIVGFRRGEVWHTTPKQKVGLTSYGAMRKRIVYAYRMLQKVETWQSP